MTTDAGKSTDDESLNGADEPGGSEDEPDPAEEAFREVGSFLDNIFGPGDDHSEQSSSDDRDY